jgi:hypothetical protein
LKRPSFEVQLKEVDSVGKTSAIFAVFGGRQMRLRTRVGKARCLWVDGLDDWIDAVKAAIAETPGD